MMRRALPLAFLLLPSVSIGQRVSKFARRYDTVDQTTGRQTLTRVDSSSPIFYLRSPDGSERKVKMAEDTLIQRDGLGDSWRAIQRDETVMQIFFKDDQETVRYAVLLTPQEVSKQRADSLRFTGVVQAVGLESHVVIISDGRGVTRKGEVTPESKVLLRLSKGRGDRSLDWKTIREGDTVVSFELNENEDAFRTLVISRGGRGVVRN